MLPAIISSASPPSTTPSATATTISTASRRFDARPTNPLVREQHRDGGFGEDVPRGAAEDELPQPALGVGALDHEVGVHRLGGIDIERAGGAALGREVAGDYRNAVRGEGLGDGL